MFNPFQKQSSLRKMPCPVCKKGDLVSYCYAGWICGCGAWIYQKDLTRLVGDEKELKKLCLKNKKETEKIRSNLVQPPTKKRRAKKRSEL